MNRVGTLAALIVLGTFTVTIGSQRQPPAKADVELQKLKDNLYLLVGGGGNSAALVTDLGVVLVDTKLAGWGQPMLDKIKTVTSKPVTTIINTHAHGDNVSGNEFFPTSVEIIAQQNTRLNMDRLDAFKGVLQTPKICGKGAVMPQLKQGFAFAFQNVAAFYAIQGTADGLEVIDPATATPEALLDKAAHSSSSDPEHDIKLTEAVVAEYRLTGQAELLRASQSLLRL